MFNITEIRRTSWVCPSQWDGKTDADEAVSVRYRWGTLTVYVNLKVVFSKHIGKPTTEEDDELVYESMRRQGWDERVILKIKSSTETARMLAANEPLCFDGLISYKEMRKQTSDVCDFPIEESLNCTKDAC